MRNTPRTAVVSAVLCLVAGCGRLDSGWIHVVRRDRELESLEQRLESIDRRLAELSRFTMQTGAGPIGYRSAARPERHRREWVRIDLGEPQPIEEIVIVPTIYRTADSELRADGFPEEFRVIAGGGDTETGRVLARFTAEDELLPRVAPVVIPCAITASWVRLEANSLSLRAWDAKYALQLSEVFVFSGGENVALHRPVTATSTFNNDTAARHERFLVDGVTPYLMDAAAGEHSAAFLTMVGDAEPFALAIDLGETTPLTGIHLHAIDVSDNVPQSHESTFGIPRWLRIEAADDPEFSAATLLADYRMESILDAGPIIALRFPETRCRHVRFTVMKPGLARGGGKAPFGFAEIECLSRGRNVAAGKPVSVTSTSGRAQVLHRSLAALTDGRTFYGNVLPQRDWLTELADRHALERERPLVQARLRDRYRREGELATLLLWLSAALAGLVTLSLAATAYLRRLAIAKTRTQIAADLHDELGASLYAIALCSDIARAKQCSGERMTGLLEEMRLLAERSGAAVKSCVNMLESSGLSDGLAADMRRTTSRLLADIDHQLVIESEQRLASLPPKLQLGLSLFFKECLTNILRHAAATRVVARLTATAADLQLTVQDDGRAAAEPGHPLRGQAVVPASLRRRARLLGGRVSATVSPSGGVTITLRVRTTPWWRLFGRWIHASHDAHASRHACRG